MPCLALKAFAFVFLRQLRILENVSSLDRSCILYSYENTLTQNASKAVNKIIEGGGFQEEGSHSPVPYLLTVRTIENKRLIRFLFYQK